MSLCEIRILAESAAREDAESDLLFSGDSAIAKLPLSESDKANIRGALLFYAATAASRTVGTLKLHNLLNL